ncbi:MAG TPA: adenylate/guanylate cyclase domain-containing protein [Ktedonobacterales bacterium]
MEVAEPSEERRIVTVLFADLTNSTQMAEAMDPEELRELLGAYFAAMARELHRHGGTVEKYIGDAIMAVFGLPIAHEDDPVRAVRAALDMRVALERFNDERRSADPRAVELHMRIGINTGEVMAASGSDGSEGHDFLITGDVVNVAARLQQMASPDTVLIGPRTYRNTRGAVIYRALPPIEVRGKAQPVRVWEALSLASESEVPAPRPRGVEGLRAPLVGRDVEMELLHTVYARVIAERRPHLVTVLGAPGIGKTRLVREFVNRLLGFSPVAGPDAPTSPESIEISEALHAPLVLEGRCPPYGEGVTYWPLAEMLRTFCGVSALEPTERSRERLLRCVTTALAEAGRKDDPVTVATYLGHTVGVESVERRQALLPADAQQLQDGLFRAWRAFFEALASMRPLMVLVDDIHWADDALLDLLEYLATRSGGVPILFACPARPELLEKRPDWGRAQRNEITLALEPLSNDETARLVYALLPGDGVPDTLRHGILAKADGNPFYVEEIVRMLIDRGILVCGDEDDGKSDAQDGTYLWRVAPDWDDSAEVTDPLIPDTVQGVLAARLDLLAPVERTVLQHAAIIGRYFWLDALQGLAPEFNQGTLRLVLEALLRKELIQESEGGADIAAPSGQQVYTFKHALIRDVTYATIPRTRRAREHARVAEWLEALAVDRSDAVVELLAQHYYQYYLQANLSRSRNVARRQAVRKNVLRYLTLAGDAACQRHVTAKAESYYSDALAVLRDDLSSDDLVLRLDLRMKRGDVRWLRAKGDAAWCDYREALHLWLGADPESASTPLPESGICPPDAPDEPANADTSIAPSALPTDWPQRGMRLYRLLVQLPTRHPGWFQNLPPHEELRAYLQRGLELADRLGQRDTLDGAALLTAKSFFWWSWPEQRGEEELLDALRSAREAVRISESLGDARGASEALDALGNMQATTTDLRGHLESQARRLFWARQIDDPAELVDIQAEVCIAFQMVGEYALAVEHAHNALQLADAADTDVLRVQALQGEVLAYFEWDRWREAVQAGERLISVAAHAPVEHSNHHRWALLALAAARVRMGQREEAERVLGLIPEVPLAQEAQYIGVFRGRLALARGAYKDAEHLLLAAFDYRSGRHILAALLAEIAELGARTGNADLTERFGAQALELGWRSGARKALAQAIRARGIVALAAGRWEDAEADLLNALNRYDDLGTDWEAARTRYALAGLARRRNAEGDADHAHEELTHALTAFKALNAVRDIARARAALAGGEVRLP